MKHNDEKFVGEYAKGRLSTSKDDRCDRAKKNEDAKLRGRLGIHRANKIIAKIDEIKSWR